MKKISTLFALMALVCTQMFAQVTITLDNGKDGDGFHFKRGNDVVVRYKNGGINPMDYIGIAHLGQEITGKPGGYTQTWAMLDTPSQPEGTCTLTNAANMGSAPDGYYYAVYLLNNGYDQASDKVPFYWGVKDSVNVAPTVTVQEIVSDGADSYGTFEFADSVLWRNLVKEISIDGEALTTDDYFLESGLLTVFMDLTAAKSMTIKSWDHPDVVVALGGTSVAEGTLENNVRFQNNMLQVVNSGNVQRASVYAVSGALVASYAMEAGLNTVDMNQFNDGIYLVEVEAENGSKTIKVVVRH